MINKILQWNVNGYRSRKQELSLILQEEDPSCICLQELKILNKQQFIDPSKLYKAYIKLPENNENNMAKGGVLVAVKTTIPHTHISLDTSLQAVAVSFPTGKLKSLCSIYLPPNINIEAAHLHEMITQLPKPTLIVGDLNAHSPLWYDHNTDPRGTQIENLINAEDLIPLNDNHPTYYRAFDQATSNIDLALISSHSAMDFNWNISEDLNGSDHYPIIISAVQPCSPQYIEKWNMVKANWQKYQELAKTTRKVQNIANIEEAYTHFKDTILTAARASIPQTKISNMKRPCLPWWTTDCATERRKTRTAYRHMKRNHNPTTVRTYRRRLAIKVRTFRKAKISSWRTYISKLQAKTPTSQVWQKIRKISGKYTPKPYPVLKIDGSNITSHKEVANAFAKHYASISSTRDQLPMPSYLLTNNQSEDPTLNIEFNMRELEGSLQQLEAKKATGQDMIENTMLKNLPSISKCYLLDLLNKLWTEGTIPKEWKTSIILPILKPGKEASNPKSYRPISLTSCICKLFERMVSARLVWFLEKNKKLSPHQFGFRPGRNTTDPIAALTTDILNGFNDSRTTTAVFFDLEKAFDTISRNTIITNLSNMGIHGKMLKFIYNYLEDRLINVKIGNTHSCSEKTQTGVPQGGVLSATLFNIAINSILEDLPPGTKGSLYADDLALYHTSKRVQTSARILQTAIKKLEKWANKTGLTFSPIKSEVVHFWRNITGGSTREYFPLKLYDEEIPRRETVRFLGMTLDRKLSWIPHIEALKAETMRSLNILRVASGVNYGADRKTLLRLYWAICKSKLDYGSQIYSSAGPNALKKLDSVHNEALRICTGAFRTSPTESLQVEAGSPPLDLHRKESCLRYLLRLESLPEYKGKLNVLNNEQDTKYEQNNRSPLPIGYRSRTLKQSLDFDPDPAENRTPEMQPWLLQVVNTCQKGAGDSKQKTTISQLKQNFLAHMCTHMSTNHIYTDGSKSTEGVGFGVVYGNSLESCIRGTLPMEATIFTAELQAIKAALNIIETSNNKRWTIFSDSQASIKAIAQQNPKHPLVKTIQTIMIQLQTKNKEICFCKVPSHVGIQGNEKADEIANEAQKLPGFHTTKIPISDYHYPIRKHILKIWQDRWDQSHQKLREIKPRVKPWVYLPGGNRRNEVKLTRLRIGHSRLTHGYYMSRGRPPECEHCRTPLSIEHILLNCQATQYIRAQLRLPNNMQSLLGLDCPALRLIEYLIETQILDEL